MEVGGILAPGTINKIGLNQWQPGERFLVNVVQKTGEGEGTIRVKGQDIFALLETSVEIGDKFWVRVGDIKDGNLLLIREAILEQAEDTPVTQRLLAPTAERGLPNNVELVTLLKSFLSTNTALLGSLMETLQGTVNETLLLNLKKSMPKWAELNEENGAEMLVECLRKLGLNYEQRLQLMLRSNSPAKELERANLRATFKYALLEALEGQQGENLKEPEGPLELLLQKITGQQLWLKSGVLDNAYLLLQLPLLHNDKFLPVQVAIESSRKGSKMDEKHCRIALQMETETLGDLGIDAFFNHDGLFMHVLTRDSQSLSQLLEEVMPETRQGFASLGFTLKQVEVGDLDEHQEFQKFLLGSRKSGVDILR